MNNSCVILFTKAPIPSLVKTRLVDKSSWNIDQVTELYEAFLMDVVETADRYVMENNFDLVISYTPQRGLNKIKELIHRLKKPINVSHFELQKGDTFDQRMNSVIFEGRTRGRPAMDSITIWMESGALGICLRHFWHLCRFPV